MVKICHLPRGTHWTWSGRRVFDVLPTDEQQNCGCGCYVLFRAIAVRLRDGIESSMDALEDRGAPSCKRQRSIFAQMLTPI